MAGKKAATEEAKMRGWLSAINPQKQAVLEPIISNVAFMKAKLEEAIRQLAKEPLTVEYDNGGGQHGERENPKFRAYEALWKSYMLGMDKILAILPPDAARDEELPQSPKTVLEIIRERHERTG